MKPLYLLYFKNGFLNWTDLLNADSDPTIFGETDILVFVF